MKTRSRPGRPVLSVFFNGSMVSPHPSDRQSAEEVATRKNSMKKEWIRAIKAHTCCGTFGSPVSRNVEDCMESLDECLAYLPHRGLFRPCSYPWRYSRLSAEAAETAADPLTPRSAPSSPPMALSDTPPTRTSLRSSPRFFRLARGHAGTSDRHGEKLGSSSSPSPTPHGPKSSKPSERESGPSRHLTRTPDRERFLLFSKPYLSVPTSCSSARMACTKGIGDMVTHRLGVVKITGSTRELCTRHPEIRPVAVEDTPTGLAMVATGQLDALLEACPWGPDRAREPHRYPSCAAPHLQPPPALRREQGGAPSSLHSTEGLRFPDRNGAFRVVRGWTGQDFSASHRGLSVSPEHHRRPSRCGPPFPRLGPGFKAQRGSGDPVGPGERRALARTVRENDIIFTIDLAGRFTSINKAAEKITGYTLDEALKMDISAVVAPEFVDAALQMLFEGTWGTAGPDSSLRSYQGRQPGGAQVLPGHFPGRQTRRHIRDPPQHHREERAEEKLRFSEEMFKVLSDRSPLGKALIDGKGRYEYVIPRRGDIRCQLQDCRPGRSGSGLVPRARRTGGSRQGLEGRPRPGQGSGRAGRESSTSSARVGLPRPSCSVRWRCRGTGSS